MTSRSTSIPCGLLDQRLGFELQGGATRDVVARDARLGVFLASLLVQVGLMLHLVELTLDGVRPVDDVVALHLQLDHAAVHPGGLLAKLGPVQCGLPGPGLVSRHLGPEDGCRLAVLLRHRVVATPLRRSRGGLVLLDVLRAALGILGLAVDLDVGRLRLLLEPELLTGEPVPVDRELGLLGLVRLDVLGTHRRRLGAQRVDAGT